MTRLHRPVVAAVALLVVVTGCRGGDAEGASSETAAPATTATPASSITATTAPDDSTATTTIPAPTSTPAAPTTTTTTAPPAPLLALAVDDVASGLSRPIVATSPPGDARLFILEQDGRIRILDPERGLLEEPFLAIEDRVGAIGIEQGLLGLAFHPGYDANGRFFVYYTDRNDDSRLEEYRRGAGPDTADPASGRLLLALEQPTVRHNAGDLHFGPDGYLYLALGDGGAARDNGQDPATWLATLLRLDVDGPEPYAVPPGNPFVAGGGAPEVWAYGLRNPWRFSIDPVEGLIYIADVGHGDWEEVNVAPLAEGGLNYGWPVLEGSHCFFGCDTAGLVLPVTEYDHSDGNCSVTGGRVYRGEQIPELAGHYLYADWCGGWVRSFRYDPGVAAAAEPADWSGDLGDFGQVTGFGVDGDGELYLSTWQGSVFKLVAVR